LTLKRVRVTREDAQTSNSEPKLFPSDKFLREEAIPSSHSVKRSRGKA